jgi:hypothetical protein
LQRSFSDWETLFSGRALHEMVPYLGRVFNGTGFNELAAARERMLDIAFHVHETPHDDRATAVSWAVVIESLIVLLFVDRPEMRDLFLNARKSSMARAAQYGYGSLGYVAIHEASEVVNRIWSTESGSSELQAVEERRAFLMSVAFGRSSDAPESGG